LQLPSFFPSCFWPSMSFYMLHSVKRISMCGRSRNGLPLEVAQRKSLSLWERPTRRLAARRVRVSVATKIVDPIGRLVLQFIPADNQWYGNQNETDGEPPMDVGPRHADLQ